MDVWLGAARDASRYPRLVAAHTWTINTSARAANRPPSRIPGHRDPTSDVALRCGESPVVPWIAMTQASTDGPESRSMTVRHRRAHSVLTGVQRLLALSAVVGVCMMPVDYRGGARTPHAHALFQLLFDAAQGSPDHHGNTVHALSDRASAPRANQRAMMVDASRAEPPALQSPLPPIEQPLAVAALIVVALALNAGRRMRSPIALVHRVGRTLRPLIPPPRPGAVAT